MRNQSLSAALKLELLPHPSLWLGAGSDGEPTNPADGSSVPDPLEREDLPYKVELWNAGRTSVEQVLAVTANGSIGYAAYYAALRDYPNRHITLRHHGRVLSQWSGTGH